MKSKLYSIIPQPSWMKIINNNNFSVSFTWDEICESAGLDEAKESDHELPKNLSTAMRHLDCGSCGACEAELTAVFDPPYFAERFGLYVVASPKEADILGVTGAYSKSLVGAAKKTFDLMPKGEENSQLIALIGDCACGEGPYKHSEECDKSLFDNIWKNNTLSNQNLIEIRGCPPSPALIMKKIITWLSKNKKK